MKPAMDMKEVRKMKHKLSIYMICIILLAVLVLLSPSFAETPAEPVAKTPAAETTPRPKPTVSPLEVRYDYRLPATQLTDENVQDFFSIELGKEYSKGKKLSVPYDISPVEAYDQYDGSSPGIAIRLELSVFLAEEDTEPYLTKSYIVMLRRTKGYKASGVIDVLLKLDQDDIWYTWEVIGCNGRVGI